MGEHKLQKNNSLNQRTEAKVGKDTTVVFYLHILFNQILFGYSKIKTKKRKKREEGSGREEVGGREERE